MKLLCATVLSIMAVVSAIQYIDCGSLDCEIDSVDVGNCAADASICYFTRGQLINITVKFTATKDGVDNLSNEIRKDVGGTWVPVETTDMCRETKRCSLSNGETITYYTVISNEYPTRNLGLRSTMVDTVNGGICTCFDMQVRIV